MAGKSPPRNSRTLDPLVQCQGHHHLEHTALPVRVKTQFGSLQLRENNTSIWEPMPWVQACKTSNSLPAVISLSLQHRKGDDVTEDTVEF